MSPKYYRNRYAVIIVLSLLIHSLIIAVFLWGDTEQEQKKKKSVTVKLKQVDKKAEPKKAEPKKAEPKKAEPKKAEPKKAEPKKAKPTKAKPTKSESQKRFSSMRMLDDRELKKAVVLSTGFDNKFKDRQQKGDLLIKSLSFSQRRELNNHLANQVGHLFKTFKSPKNDGKKYSGAISILLDDNGYIEFLTFKRRSGHDALDEAVYKSIVEAKKLELPNEPRLRKAMTTRPLTSTYTEKDMAD
jgi:outer membrane biosynthesis protein TonB